MGVRRIILFKRLTIQWSWIIYKGIFTVQYIVYILHIQLKRVFLQYNILSIYSISNIYIYCVSFLGDLLGPFLSIIITIVISSALLLAHTECIQCIIAIGQILIVWIAVCSPMQTSLVMNTCPRDLIRYTFFLVFFSAH